MATPRVILHARRARPFFGRHPWVFAGAIAGFEGEPADGDEVEIFSHGGNFIARGFYNGKSRIRARLYSWDADRPLDRDFFRERLTQAINLRRDPLRLTPPQPPIGSPGWEGSACRLVFSEGDGLSGLTIDQYDRWAVVQFTSLGMAQRKQLWSELLQELVQPAGIFVRTERGIGKLEGLELQDGPLWGDTPADPVLVREPGPGYTVEYLVNIREGQKTGFYIDQRENRQAVARYAEGRRMLDAFCYSGGFGLHAALAGAKEVVAVDSSEAAVELARLNAAQNGIGNYTCHQAEVFEFLEAAVRDRQKFDLLVLDPPKFARTQHAVDSALRGYRRLQSLAMLLLNPGGILAVCCCSGLITIDMLEELASQVAAESKRFVQILERRGQPPDHPVAVSCLESAYLKCLVMRVV
jgi:23S rRNA (cytosine1962-C5)-methyltransferase